MARSNKKWNSMEVRTELIAKLKWQKEIHCLKFTLVFEEIPRLRVHVEK